MIGSLKAELLKLTTTRATYGLLLGELAVVALTVGSTVLSSKPDSLAGPLHDQVFFLLASINVGLFSLIIGMRVVTDEYRHGTITHPFLSDPGRSRTVVAKGMAGALAAVTVAAVSVLAMVAMALPLASAKGGELSLAGSDMSAFLSFLGVQGMWAVIGVGVGAMVRHQVAAIVGGLVWVLVIENLGSGFLGNAGGYLPGQAAYASGRALDTSTAVEPATGAVILTLYALAALLMGILVTRRRDVY